MFLVSNLIKKRGSGLNRFNYDILKSVVLARINEILGQFSLTDFTMRLKLYETAFIIIVTK